MSPLSGDPERRRRQLANPPNMRGEASAAPWKPGDAPHLQHGARSRRPQKSPEWSPAVQGAIGDLEQRVGDELRDEAGQLYPWALPSIETVGIQPVASWRLDRYVADQDARGALRPADLDMQSRIAERYSKALDREAMTLRSRLEARATGFDLAQAMSALEDDDEERGAVPELELLRRELGAFSLAAGAPLTPWQVEALRLETRTTAVVAPRQSGKSRSLAVAALWWAFRRREQRCLVVSAGEEASRRLLSEVRRIAAGSPWLRPSVTDENAGLLLLSNGSEIRSVPASERQVRGWSTDLLLVDEAALVPDDLLLGAAIPTTAARPDARIVLASSATVRVARSTTSPRLASAGPRMSARSDGRSPMPRGSRRPRLRRCASR